MGPALALLLLTSNAVPSTTTCPGVIVDSAAQNLERAGFDFVRAGVGRAESDWVRLRLTADDGTMVHTRPVRVVLESTSAGVGIQVRHWTAKDSPAESPALVLRAIQRGACESPQPELPLRAEVKLIRAPSLESTSSVLLRL